MYARVSTYQIKPDRIDDMLAKVEAVRGQVRNVPGLLNSYSAWRDDGHGVTTGIYESAEAAEAASAAIGAVWSGLAEFLVAPPQVQNYDNVMHMSE